MEEEEHVAPAATHALAAGAESVPGYEEPAKPISEVGANGYLVDKKADSAAPPPNDVSLCLSSSFIFRAYSLPKGNSRRLERHRLR